MSKKVLHKKCVDIYMDIMKNSHKVKPFVYRPMAEFDICLSCLEIIVKVVNIEKEKEGK